RPSRCPRIAALPLAALARGATVSKHTPPRVAALAVVGRHGQPGGPSNPSLSPVDVRARHYAILSAVTRVVVEPGGIHPAYPQTPSFGGPPSPDSRRDSGVAGSDGAGMEPKSDAVCVGWPARFTPRPESAASISTRGLWGVCRSPPTALPNLDA